MFDNIKNLVWANDHWRKPVRLKAHPSMLVQGGGVFKDQTHYSINQSFYDIHQSVRLFVISSVRKSIVALHGCACYQAFDIFVQHVVGSHNTHLFIPIFVALVAATNVPGVCRQDCPVAASTG